MIYIDKMKRQREQDEFFGTEPAGIGPSSTAAATSGTMGGVSPTEG